MTKIIHFYVAWIVSYVKNAKSDKKIEISIDILYINN